MISEDFINSTLISLAQIGLYRSSDSQSLNIDQDLWIVFYKKAQNHTIQGIVFDSFQYLNKNSLPPKKILIPWLIELENIEKANRKQIETINRLQNLFFEQSLEIRILKGQGLAKLYPNTLHRVCGDIDLWFKSPEEAEKACKIIESIGIDVIRGEQYDSHYYFNGIEIEHHYNLIELHNPFIQKRLKKWESEVFAKSTLYPTPCANLLLQITHILKHELNEGIGFRQIFDLAISLKSLEYDKKEFEILCKRFGVYKWAQLLFALLIHFFDVKEKELPFPAKGNPTFIFEEIWQSGNFGYTDKRFSNVPNHHWARKLFTAKRLIRKITLLFYYAPAECFWNTFLLIIRRIKEKLNLK